MLLPDLWYCECPAVVKFHYQMSLQLVCCSSIQLYKIYFKKPDKWQPCTGSIYLEFRGYMENTFSDCILTFIFSLFVAMALTHSYHELLLISFQEIEFEQETRKLANVSPDIQT